MSLSRRQTSDSSMPGMYMGDDLGSSSPGAGVPGYFYMQKVFWMVIGAAIAFATLVNLLNKALAWQRQRTTSAKPKSVWWTSFATATAICREISSVSAPSCSFRGFRIRSPPLGKVLIVLAYLTVVLTLCFYGYNTSDQWSWENIAYRAGCIAQTQLPLIFLLAGKQNVIGWLTGLGYERLSWIHRWTARIMWLTATIHMGFWFRSWARYDYILVKLTTDRMTQTGFSCWCIFTFIVAITFAPIRRWNYEVFVITHVILFAGLTGAIMNHVDDGKHFIWVCVTIFFFDRLLRLASTAFINLNIFHWSRLRNGIWSNTATITPLPGNVTRITIDNPVTTWKPGQHVFLSCHSVVPLQSHPFTISSLPSDNKMEFLVKAHGGGTKRFHRYAFNDDQLPDCETVRQTRKHVGIEGPYGRMRPLQQFDSVVLFAGSTGSTFTMPLMRDIVRRWQSSKAPVTRHVRFVWAIKSRDRLCWFREELEQAIDSAALLQAAGQNVELDVTVYVTCDEQLEADVSSPPICRPQSQHGDAIEVGTKSELPLNEKERKDSIEVASVSSTEKSSKKGCQPDGGCCCKATVEDGEDAPPCSCCNPLSSSSSISEKGAESEEAKPAKRESPIRLFTGRPHPRNIIRKVLEEAEGESAVIVCGPQGLQDDVRMSVVALSDERAVHKGTGAQGVYLHVEGFCY